MEDILVDKEQRVFVEPGTKPTATSTKDWEKMDRKGRSTIFICLSNLVLLNVSAEDSRRSHGKS